MAFPTNSTGSFFFSSFPLQTRLCNSRKLHEESKTSNDLAGGHSKSMELD
ncbi:hypothetical protein WN51_01461 [Melipona quadrifasciata]|uniref:Uncharacterized protein n=1 Tax=Melipona quadrifasciata TaxID=166423 RepID=A0A0N0BEU2_9HYME|nr:hypothetical protein WN51_01461 [Melipona quadrifasciata]